MTEQNRSQFRENCFQRDNHRCVVPWCEREAVDAHHIIERSEWRDGGYIQKNGASVCSHHHKAAEKNLIPPQSFWMWLGIEEPITPEGMSKDVNKWGKEFDTPPWEEYRERIKYPSTRHLLPLYWYDSETTAQERIEHDDTGLSSIEEFVGIPLVVTEKVDGGNCMIVSDIDNPVRARNGSRPEDTMKPLYRDGGLYWRQEVNRKLPDRLQVFGEWVYAKHSIHYGCDCEDPCQDIGPSLSELTGIEDDRSYFQIFGVYDKNLNIWLSWPRVEEVSNELGFPTTPVIYKEDDEDSATFNKPSVARNQLIEYARDVIQKGGEGIVVRSKYPYHYSQFESRVGKYVRENHVNSDEHWKFKEKKQNRI